ncbi:MAG: hypothetical protein HY694_07845 [Deltaproteobacteria bacterium]|nr:hypothetical protein [Deltaproteobacteria bacterium]
MTPLGWRFRPAACAALKALSRWPDGWPMAVTASWYTTGAIVQIREAHLLILLERRFSDRYPLFFSPLRRNPDRGRKRISNVKA